MHASIVCRAYVDMICVVVDVAQLGEDRLSMLCIKLYELRGISKIVQQLLLHGCICVPALRSAFPCTCVGA